MSELARGLDGAARLDRCRHTHLTTPSCIHRPRGADEARDIFKTLKNQHLADTRAAMYHEWAVLEHSAGNVSKALGIIAKGLRADAQPARWVGGERARAA